MPKSITTIPRVPQLEKPKRVAAYARVSCEKDAMLHSLAEQVSYFSELIQKTPGWVYAGVYSDEAETGTKTDRDAFQQLMDDCRAGKIDIVVTKSLTRFARNTVVLLESVRELRSLGIDVFFEKENVHGIDGGGELLLSILASYAQEESRSVSENQKWRIRKGFENGELINLRFLFGYNISKGSVQIDPETAPIVKEIFGRVIAGESFGAISRDLNCRGIERVLGGKWSARRIREIAENEKYTGNALLQKKYINNHIDKKEVVNKGELPQYYAEDTHPAIIDMATFESAQAVLRKVAATHDGRPKPQKSEFTGRIICPHCGKSFKRMTSNGSVGWNCTTYLMQGKEACHGKKIPDATLKTVCTEVLGLLAYDPAVFTERIEHIEVPQDNHLLFFLKDGRITDRTWADRSRRESWTPEMKAQASQRTREQRRKQSCQE